MTKAFEEILPNLYVFRDTCNVYVLKDNSRAILIDLGSGEIFKYLDNLNIERIDWILFTHHHREVCQGFQKIINLPTCNNVKIAAPIYELELFTQPSSVYQNLLSSKWCVGGITYTRPPREPIPIARCLVDSDDFKWGDYILTVRFTPGNSPGAVSFLSKIAGKIVCFCGDVIMAGGKLHNYYDSDWDYGYGYGIKTLWSSVELLKSLEPEILCPSQGPIMSPPKFDPKCELYNFADKLWNFRRFLLRDWDMDRNHVQSESISQPTSIGGIRKITDHLYKIVQGNMYILLSETGRALLIDCASLRPAAERWLNEKLDAMELTFGLKTIDAIIPTHYHGDHLLDIPIVKQRYDSEVWAYENMAEILEFPDRFNLIWLLPAYRTRYKSIHVDRILYEGETLKWQEYQLNIFNLPGQTLYAVGLSGQIDGKFIAFTGDNIFYTPIGSGHDAFVTRNVAILEEGYIKCGEILNHLKPDFILGGHGQEIPQPLSQINELLSWGYTFREVLKKLSPYCEYEYLIDPYWAMFYPYKIKTIQGSTILLRLVIKNYRNKEMESTIDLMIPKDWKVVSRDKRRIKVKIPSRDQKLLEWKIEIPNSASAKIYLITSDLAIDKRKIGEFPEAIVEVKQKAKK